jgi:hypothetical protein
MSSAADRLARTRLALIESVHSKEKRKEQGLRGAMASQQGEQGESAEAAAASGGGGWAGGMKRAVESWWYHHPARLGVQLATPMLSSYARRKPLQYLGIAAGVGVVFMIARPWRLISAGGLLMALARSPQLATIVMAAMSSSDEGGGDGG